MADGTAKNLFKFSLVGCFGCGGAILFVVIGFGIWYMSVNRTDSNARADVAAEQDKCKIIYDEMWKVITEQAQVPEAYKEAFRDTWKDIVNGNSAQQKASISAFVTRYNPQFDSKLYSKLMTTIEHKRKEFSNAQIKMRDVKRQHDRFRTAMPVNSQLGRAIFGTFEEIPIQLVLSDKTNNAFEAGKDEALDIFKKKETDAKKAPEIEVIPKKD